MTQQIIIASDHAGYPIKAAIARWLADTGWEVTDLGTDSLASVDYPDFAHPLAERVASGEFAQGILVCGSGQGVCMSANKHAGVRAALCWAPEVAMLTREHNDANVLCIPGRAVNEEVAKTIVLAFLHTAFAGGRHGKRVEKINLG